MDGQGRQLKMNESILHGNLMLIGVHLTLTVHRLTCIKIFITLTITHWDMAHCKHDAI